MELRRARGGHRELESQLSQELEFVDQQADRLLQFTDASTEGGSQAHGETEDATAQEKQTRLPARVHFFSRRVHPGVGARGARS